MNSRAWAARLLAWLAGILGRQHDPEKWEPVFRKDHAQID
jgi:hypothetical protein